jgi:hypothetical protein
MAAADFDAIAAGYKLLALGSSGGGEGGASPPAGGDSRTTVFDKRGFRWTLPPAPEAADKPRWDFLQDSEADPHRTLEDSGLLAHAQLHAGENGLAAIWVLAPKISGGGTDAKGFVNNDHNFKDLIENNFEGTPAPDIDEDVKLGNKRGASRSLTGKGKDGRALWIKEVFVSVRDVLTIVRVAAWEKAERTNKAEIDAAVQGFAWEDTSEGFRGPWVSPLPASSVGRKEGKTPTPEVPFLAEDAGKAAPIVVAGLSGTKPAAFTRVRFNAEASSLANILYLAEGRKPNGYMFFSIWRAQAAAFQNPKAPKTIESVIDEHETNWKDGLAEPKTLTQRGGKANKVAGDFKGNKGFRYEFSGKGADVPVFERGWVFKAGQSVYWIRTQYVGPEAEKAFEPDWKAFASSLKFE